MLLLWQDVTCGMEKLKPLFPGALGHTQEKGDRQGELGHASIALFTIPMFGEIISTIFFKYQLRDIITVSLFRIFIKAQNHGENNISLHIHIK